MKTKENIYKKFEKWKNSNKILKNRPTLDLQNGF